MMNNIIEWDYDKSVQKIKPLILKWKNITVDIAKELWEARKVLSRQGKRTDLGANGSKSKTWKQYCYDIGMAKSTINRWLERYEPEKQILLTDKEYKEKRGSKKNEKKIKENLEKEKEKKEYDNDFIKKGLENLIEKEKEKEELRKKIKLGGNNATESFYDVLDEYLLSFDELQRMEVCHNIIKYCKAIVSELQRKSVK